MRNKILSIIIIAVLSIGGMGCGNILANKSLETEKTFIENKEYDKALVSLEMSLDEDSENGEANRLYRILEKYMESKDLVDNNKFNEAEETINKLNTSSFEGISIEEDINKLKESIEKHKQKENEQKKKDETKKEESKSQLQETQTDTKISTENEISNTNEQLCSICKDKLIYDSDGNGICDYKCDKLCTNC